MAHSFSCKTIIFSTWNYIKKKKKFKLSSKENIFLIKKENSKTIKLNNSWREQKRNRTILQLIRVKKPKNFQNMNWMIHDQFWNKERL